MNIRRHVEPDSGIRGKRMSEVKYAIAILKEKLSNADRHNLAYQRLSIADMEAIWGVLSKCESDYAELKAQREELAAEVSAIREQAENVYAAGYQQGHLNTVDGIAYASPIETEFYHNALQVMLEVETPATDAYLNSVRAEGADKVAEYHFVRIDVLKEVSRQGHLFHKAAYSDAVNVANIFRAGKDGE